MLKPAVNPEKIEPLHSLRGDMIKTLTDHEVGPLHIAPLAVGIADACRLTGLGRSKLYELLNAGEIPSLKIGKRRVVRVQALREWLGALDHASQSPSA